MAFVKRVAILKELENGFALNGKKINGIVRIEQAEGVSELYLSTINVGALTGGSFYLFIIDFSKEVFYFNLGTRPYLYGKVFENNPDIEKGFSAGLCFVKDDLPITIAFGLLDNSPTTLSDFKRLVAETCLNKRRKKLREKEELAERELYVNQSEPKQCENTQNSSCFSYDDEAVATENYYAIEGSINDKLLQIKENQNAFIPNENAMPFEFNQKETEKSEPTTHCNQNETGVYNCQKYSATNPYYLTVKKELDEVFNKFPPDKNLCTLFADSRWSKVKYATDKYYVVGLVKEDDKEKYICYGVPDKYSVEPPETLKDCACFIPLSVFDLKGEGYWMMFQDAVTGNCIKLKPKIFN